MSAFVRKKSLFAVFSLLFLNVFGIAEIGWWADETTHIFQAGSTYQSKTSFLPYSFSFQSQYELDKKQFKLKNGINIGKDAFDVFIKANYTPSIYSGVYFGATGTVHILIYNDSFIDVDILSGFVFLLNFPKHFSFETDFNYFTKTSYIKFIPGPLSSTGVAFSMLFTLKIPAIMDIHLKLASYSDYYYMIFFSPLFSLGIDVPLSEIITFCADYSVKFTDLFTFSAYFDSYEARTFVRIKI